MHVRGFFLIYCIMVKISYNIAIVGATGLIGKKFIETLEKRRFRVGDVRLFASEKSAGKKIFAFGKERTIECLENNDFSGTDFALFSAGKDVSRIFAPKFAKSGAIVIDNSSEFRLNPEVPLVIPEINGESIFSSSKKIIANPNCSTIIALMPLKSVFKKYTVKRIIFSSYQATSGSGAKGVKDLLRTRYGFSPEYYPCDISETVLPEIGSVASCGYTEEELKMINETRKITGLNIPISATCVRVPVENCHGVSVEVETEERFSISELKGEMQSDGVRYKEIPTGIDSNGKDYVVMGRLKKSMAFKNGFSYFVSGDNTLKGAALNAVQIAEYITEINR